MTPTNQPVFRPLTAEDAAGWRPLWSVYLAEQGSGMVRSDKMALLARLTGEGGSDAGLVVEVDGAIVGFAHFQIRHSDCAWETAFAIQDVFIAKEHRGVGIGAMLVQAIYQRALSSGFAAVYWETAENTYRGRKASDALAVKSRFFAQDKAA